MLNSLPDSEQQLDSLTSFEQCYVVLESLCLLKVDDVKLSLQPFRPPVLLYALLYLEAFA